MKKKDEAQGPSCWTKALDDERVFVLLARDPAAPAAIRTWASERVKHGLNRFGEAQIQEALRCADLMESERASVREALQPKAPEVGWLIESKTPYYPIWWAGNNCWTSISGSAIRFARKRDAEDIIRRYNLRDSIATEHSWG